MNSFKKEERLCSRKLLNLLFSNGSSFLLYPFRVSFLYTDTHPTTAVQVVINVPKKRFKKAVDRNLVKRRIREVYRLNKFEAFYTQLPVRNELLLLSLHYVGKEIYASEMLERKLLLVFKKLVSSVSNEIVK